MARKLPEWEKSHKLNRNQFEPNLLLPLDFNLLHPVLQAQEKTYKVGQTMENDILLLLELGLRRRWTLRTKVIATLQVPFTPLLI